MFLEFVNSKINGNSMSELGYVIASTVLILGVLSYLSKAIEQKKWLDELSNEIISSIPRTIYFFGSSITGTLLAVGFFMQVNPGASQVKPELMFGMSFMIGLGAFLYGCGANYVHERKKLAPSKQKQ